MRPEVGRRVFVGTVAAGLPLLAGKAALFAQSGVIAHDHAPLAATDPVIDQIVRQIAAICNAAHPPRGEHARALSMQLRMLAVYERQLGVDDHVRAAMREMVQRDGRQAVLYADPDPEGRRMAMQKYGFRLENRQRDAPLNPTHAAREAALDGLLEGGITPVFEQLAAIAGKAAAQLDRRGGSVITIAQDDTDWWKGYCHDLYQGYLSSQLAAAPFCLLAKYFEWAVPSCLAMEGGAAFLLAMWLIQCMPYGYF